MRASFPIRSERRVGLLPTISLRALNGDLALLIPPMGLVVGIIALIVAKRAISRQKALWTQKGLVADLQQPLGSAGRL